MRISKTVFLVLFLVACADLQLYVDNTFIQFWAFHVGQDQIRAPVVVFNYMVDLNPGNHIVEFKISNFPRSKLMVDSKGQTSIMAIPVE